METVEIRDLDLADSDSIREAAELLVLGFSEHWPRAWPHLEAALHEVLSFDAPGRLCRSAFDQDGFLVGWCGGISEYRGNVFELHPLVVRPTHHRQGIGTALVLDFEEQVYARGGRTVILGSDDEDDMTSLSGVELYPEPWVHLQHIRNLKYHPFEFYLKLGYQIVGVIPHANGWGKPDILMAKSLHRGSQPTTHFS